MESYPRPNGSRATAQKPPALCGRHLVVGPARHGVVTHALRLADAHDRLLDVTQHVASRHELAEHILILGSGPVLLPVTDRLLGATPEEAALAVERAARSAPLVLALHDIPQPEEGLDWFRRRREAYRRFAAVASRVVVASQVERRRLLGLLDEDAAERLDARLRVVPLPLSRGHSRSNASAPQEVATLGFLYPGKGLEDLVDAVARTPGVPRVVTNYGAPAPGHVDQVRSISRYAARRGVEFRVTGYLPDAELLGRLGAAGIPVAPHRHVSASGSVGTWVAAGRRPLVRDLGWFRELAVRAPGAVTVARSLPAALAMGVADPASTWLAEDVQVGPSWRRAAEAHLRVLSEVA